MSAYITYVAGLILMTVMVFVSAGLGAVDMRHRSGEHHMKDHVTFARTATGVLFVLVAGLFTYAIFGGQVC